MKSYNPFSSLAGVLAIIMIFSACKNIEKLPGIEKRFTPFGVCFAKVTPDQVKNYNMVIIEPDHYSRAEILALKNTGTQILAYISLGEVDTNRWYYPYMEERGFLGINPNWKSPYLNLEDPVTRSILLKQVLPEIMIKGVDGLFLDTIDAVAPYTDRAYLQPFMIDIIRTMRRNYPEASIIQNAGIFLLDQTNEYLDAVLIEDIASGYDFSKQKYFIKSEDQFRERAQFIKDNISSTGLPVFIVDFAKNRENREVLKNRLDSLNYPYFISNIGLTELPVLPSEVANRIIQ